MEEESAAAAVEDLQTMKKLYYDSSQASSFSSRWKLEAAALKRSYPTGKIGDWLLRKDAYTLHRPARKSFSRNPYTVNNLVDLWEFDLTDMSFLISHDGGNKYLLNAYYAFSKYAYSVPIRSKAAEAVVSAFRSILARTSGRRPLVVRMDKGKEFVNTKFRKLLGTEGMEMKLCRNPDVKCAIVERINKSLRSKRYMWFTWKKTYRYVDVLDKFVCGYTAHCGTVMAPSLVSDMDVLRIWDRMKKQLSRIKKVRSTPIYSVGQTVRISKDKMQFAKAFKQNWKLKVFKISKVLGSSPRHLYVLEDVR